MKLNTPEGIKDAEPLEFSLEEAERPIKLILADGNVPFFPLPFSLLFLFFFL